MKRLSVVAVVVLLSACAFPSKFDSNEQARITDIVTWTVDEKAVCENANRAFLVARDVDDHARWLVIYGGSIPDNDALTTMYVRLREISRDMVKRYGQGPDKDPSRTYCELKVKNINRAAKTMLDVSGRRPRS